MSTDLQIDLSEARSVLDDAGQRTSALFASAADPALAVRRSAWNLGEVGAHLVVALRGFTDAVEGRYDAFAPYIPTTGSFADRLSAVTAGTLALETERAPGALGRMITERIMDFMASTAARSGEERIPTPWYGHGASLSVAEATALLAGEQLVHGYDVAGSLGQKWPISVSDARLVMQAVTAMMPLTAKPATAAGLRASFAVTVRQGGPRFAVEIDGGTVTVVPGVAQRADCHISGDAVDLVLLGYGRISQWGPIAGGRLRTWGRKPWLAFRFTNLFFNP
jgi:hypothetical protein